MNKSSTDKYLVCIVLGSIVLIITALVMVRNSPNPSYMVELSPKGVAHNYLLSIQENDYIQAYEYLSSQIDGYPDSADDFEDLVVSSPWEFKVDDNDNIQLEVIEVDVVDERARVLIRETRFYSGGIFSDGYSLSTFRMNLNLDSGGWKVRSSSEYWSTCLNDKSRCS
jgi:hypothetical protein